MRGKKPDPDVAAKSIELILERVASGLSVRQACAPRDVKVSKDWFYQRLAKDEGLQARFNEAKRAGCFALQDQLSDHLDDLDRDLRKTRKVMTDVGEIEVPAYDPKIASAMVHATKTRIDATKWVLAKMLPKLYGVAADLPSGGTVNLNMNLGETTGADA